MRRRFFVNQLMVCCIYPFLPQAKPRVMHAPGVIVRRSQHAVRETIDNFEFHVLQRGGTVYARINQAAEVAKNGQHLFPLEYLLFGNPMAGGPLMLENPLVALDLPLKVIAWQDEEGKVWVAYNDGAYLELRYSIAQSSGSVLYLDQLVELAIL